MSRSIVAGIAFAASRGAGGPVFAVDAASVPDAKKSAQGLYLTADDVPSFLASHKRHTLFVDVRAPEELAASGVADAVDASAPGDYHRGRRTPVQSRLRSDGREPP